MSSLPPKKGKSSTNGTSDSTVYRITRICGTQQQKQEKQDDNKSNVMGAAEEARCVWGCARRAG